MFTESEIIVGTFNGVLVIGDPHVSSRRPGRRQDDYESSVLGKLSEAAAIARKRNLLPLITGDLIHREHENSIKLLHRLTRVLQEFHVTPVDVEGNHGKAKSKLSIGDIESLLHDLGVLRVVSDTRLFASIQVNGRKVQLFGCPHGDDLPTDLASLGAEQGAVRVLITHHDLAFENAYPGAVPLSAIANCDAAINGHMHKTSAPVQLDATTWHCPGNIEPLSIDVRDHRPAVWELGTDPSQLTPHYLAHNQDCFNMVGFLVAAQDSSEAVAALAEDDRSTLPDVPEFMAEMQLQDAANINRTEDASSFTADVESVLADSGASDATQQLMRMLLARVQAKVEQK